MRAGKRNLETGYQVFRRGGVRAGDISGGGEAHRFARDDARKRPDVIRYDRGRVVEPVHGVEGGYRKQSFTTVTYMNAVAGL